MKKVLCAAVMCTLLFTTACGYRTKGHVNNGDRVLITPENVTYNWTNLGWDFVTDESKATVIGTIDEWNIIIPENSPNDNILILYNPDPYLIVENPPVYAKEGYALPFFDVADEIEALFFITIGERSAWFGSDDYSEFIADYQLDIDIDSFVSSQEQVSWFGDRLGFLVYKFKNTGDIYFTAMLCTVEDDESKLCVVTRGLNNEYIVNAFSKEILGSIFSEE